MKKKAKTLRAKAWKLLSEVIRREAADENGFVCCYTSGSIAHWTEVDAGHAIPGRTNGVLFDERIIRPQCRYDNRMRSGKLEIFIPKLMREYGWTLDDWEAIVNESRGAKKITVGEYEDMISNYQKRLNALGG